MCVNSRTAPTYCELPLLVLRILFTYMPQLLQVYGVSADYELSVLFLSYENPSHRVCVNDQCSVTRCCDDRVNAYPADHSCVDPGDPLLPCDNYFSFRFCSVESCTENISTYYWMNDDNHSFAVGENRLGRSAPNPYTADQDGNWEVRVLLITIMHVHQFQCFY